MSRDKNGLFVDTGLLRDHVSKLREEKKVAARLYENVAAMKNVSDPTVSYQYDPVLRDIEQLMEYFGRMANLLDHIVDDAVQLSLVLSTLVEDDTELTRRIASHAFML